jgi:hypothetical protein
LIGLTCCSSLICLIALQSLVDSLVGHQKRLERSLRDRQDELKDLKTTIAEQERRINSLTSKLSKAEQELREQDLIHQQRSLEIQRLRDDIARLERECIFLRGCVEKGLQSIHTANAEGDAMPVTDRATAGRHSPSVHATQRDDKRKGRELSPSRLAGHRVVHASDPSLFDAATRATVGEGSTRNTRFIDVSVSIQFCDKCLHSSP